MGFTWWEGGGARALPPFPHISVAIHHHDHRRSQTTIRLPNTTATTTNAHTHTHIQYPQHRYAVAQIETLSAATAAGLRFTPTFAFYGGPHGRTKVDEVVGREPRRLEDHLWLHSDE